MAVMSIKGNYIMGPNVKNILQSRWNGIIFIDDDGWFEGIANQSSRKEDKTDLIFGVHTNGKFLLFRVVKDDKTDATIIYCEDKKHKCCNRNIYSGDFAVLMNSTITPVIGHVIAAGNVMREEALGDSILGIMGELNQFGDLMGEGTLFSNVHNAREQLAEAMNSGQLDLKILLSLEPTHAINSTEQSKEDGMRRSFIITGTSQ